MLRHKIDRTSRGIGLTGIYHVVVLRQFLCCFGAYNVGPFRVGIQIVDMQRAKQERPASLKDAAVLVADDKPEGRTIHYRLYDWCVDWQHHWRHNITYDAAHLLARRTVNLFVQGAYPQIHYRNSQQQEENQNKRPTASLMHLAFAYQPLTAD